VYPASIEPYPVTFHAFAEEAPGPQWRAHFDRHWPALRRALLDRMPAELSPIADAEAALRRAMPELVPTWERMVELADDPLAARVLTLADDHVMMPGGCSQGVVDQALVRNYEFTPDQFEATIWLSALTGRRVLGVTAGLWGLLDGINDAGLAASVAFGGQRLHGPGFAIPLVVRYLLEVCDDLADVAELLPGLPPTEAYNLTVADATGAHASFFLTPGEPPRVSPENAVTNHQETITWPEYAVFSRTIERQELLNTLVNVSNVDTVTTAMLRPPLYCTDYGRSFGTLYTAVYRTRERAAEYRWPDLAWRQSIDNFTPGQISVLYESS
jgi:predicted choloylglycine hydrolase